MRKIITHEKIKALDVNIKAPYIRKHYYKLRSVGVNIKDAYVEVSSYFKT